MSFFSDLFEGNFSNLGTDLSHAPESLGKHPSELYETIGGAAALATGGIGLGLLGGEAGAAGLGSLGGLLGEGGTAVASGAESAGLDALAAGAAPELAPAVDAASTLGGDFSLGGAGLPSTIGDYLGAGGAAGGDVTGAAGGAGGGTFFDSSAASAAYGGGSSGGAGGGGGGMFSGVMDSITHPTLGGLSKAAGVGVAGGLLGYDMLKGNPTDPNQVALKQKADQLGAQGDTLRNYLATGTLPPALKAQLDQATKAEKARIVSGYAAKGMPTDPNMNSSLAQELNAVDTNAVAAMAQAQIQMLNTGINETGMSTQLYETLVKLDTAQNDQLMKAISSFAAALGGGGGMSLKLA